MTSHDDQEKPAIQTNNDPPAAAGGSAKSPAARYSKQGRTAGSPSGRQSRDSTGWHRVGTNEGSSSQAPEDSVTRGDHFGDGLDSTEEHALGHGGAEELVEQDAASVHEPPAKTASVAMPVGDAIGIIWGLAIDLKSPQTSKVTEAFDVVRNQLVRTGDAEVRCDALEDAILKVREKVAQDSNWPAGKQPSYFARMVFNAVMSGLRKPPPDKAGGEHVEFEDSKHSPEESTHGEEDAPNTAQEFRRLVVRFRGRDWSHELEVLMTAVTAGLMNVHGMDEETAAAAAQVSMSKLKPRKGIGAFGQQDLIPRISLVVCKDHGGSRKALEKVLRGYRIDSIFLS